MKQIKVISTLGAGLVLMVGSASAASLVAYYEFEGGYANSSGAVGAAIPTQNPGEVNIVPGGFRGQGVDINDPAAAGGGNTGGSLNIPINVNPDVLPGVTFGGWVNLETSNGFSGFMAIDNGGWDRGIQLQDNWGIASGGNTNAIAPATIGAWQFVVGTFDKPTDRATLYVGDSNPFTVTTASGTRADAGAAPGELQIEIGRYDNQDLDASLDDIFVFDAALNAHQVNAIRNLRLSTLDLSVADAADLFNLFDANGSGSVGGLVWSPTSGLSATNPGEVFDMGAGRWALVLDGSGNGLLGVPEPAAPFLAGLGALLLLLRRRRA